MDARLYVEADASAIGLAYPVQNCAAVAVKADASVKHVKKYKSACRKSAFWSNIHVPYEHIADIFVQD